MTVLESDQPTELASHTHDYLNFFELIGGLRGLGQIRDQDVKLLFDYPLQRIVEDDTLIGQIQSQGYEHLERLLGDLKYTKMKT